MEGQLAKLTLSLGMVIGAAVLVVFVIRDHRLQLEGIDSDGTADTSTNGNGNGTSPAA